jgi:hypothetical protein
MNMFKFFELNVKRRRRINMAYTIDLKQISIQQYKEIMKNQNLLPGRRILLTELDENFKRITDSGVSDLSILKSNLSSGKKLSSFSLRTGISVEYLTILRRELGSLEQKSVNISDFPNIREEITVSLSSHGIKTSKDFYESYQKSDTDTVIVSMGIKKDEFDELSCLCGLVRINGVGAVAARMLYESDYKDIRGVADGDPLEMLNKLSEINSIEHYYGAKLGIKDVKFIIYYAKFILNFE